MKHCKLTAAAVLSAMAITLFGGCSLRPAVAVIDNDKITADEYSFYLAMERIGLEVYFEDPSAIDYTETIENDDGTTTTLEQALKDRAFTQLCYYRAYSKFAHDNGVYLDDEDYEALKEQKEAAIENAGSRDDFLKALSEDYGTTEKGYDIASETTALMEKADPILFGDEGLFKVSDEDKEKIKADFYENYLHCVHVVKYKYNPGTGEDYSEEEIATKKSVIGKAYEAYQRNGDLNAVSNDYSDDAEEGVTDNDYYFSKTDVEKNDVESELQFLGAVQELKVGEDSGIREFDDGFYIIKRLELEEEYLDELYSEALSELINEKIGAYIEKQKIEKHKALDDIPVDGI